MAYNNYDAFVKGLVQKRDKDMGVAPASVLDKYKTNTPLQPQQNPMSLVTRKQDVSFDNVYQRLNSGEYIPQFESYTTGINEEERLSAQQGRGEKIYRGFGKFWAKTATNVFDATVGTANGVYEMISQGRVSAFYDNDFEKKLDDYRTRVDADLVHYYNQEEKSMNFIQKLGTTNFWANDFGDAMAFLAGAALPEVLIGLASGGTSVPLSLAKFGARTAKAVAKKELKRTGKELLEETAKKSFFSNPLKKIDDLTKFSEGRSIMRSYNTALLGDKVGGVVSTAGFLVRTTGFEAGMESRHNLKEATDKYIADYQEQNGRMPDVNEIGDFTTKAVRASNGVFLANVGILSVSNAAMFGKLLGVRLPKMSQNNTFNRALGLGYNLEAGVGTAQAIGRGRKLIGNAYQLGKRPFSEGLFEEGLQGVAGKTMQGYLETTYDSENMETEAFMASLGSAMAEQYGTKEGWNEIGVGMLVGAIGGGIMANSMRPITGKGAPLLAGTFSDSFSAQRKNVQTKLDAANKATEALRTDITAANPQRNLLRSSARASSASKADATELGMRKTNFQFALNQMEIMTPEEVIENYNAVVNSTPLTAEQKKALGDQNVTETEYKEKLTTDFARTVKDIRFADRVTNALSIQNVETSKGNKILLKEAMMWNIINGKDAEYASNSLAMEIQRAVGKEGIADAVTFFSQISDKGREKVIELDQTTGALEKAKQEVINSQVEISKLQAERKGRLKDATLEGRIDKASQRYALAAETVTRLSTEITSINKALETEKATVNLNFGEFAEQDSLFFAQTAAQSLTELNMYIDALESTGKTKEAGALREIMTEFAVQADLHREFVNAHTRMLEGDFFQSDKGRGMLSRLIGDKYKMPISLIRALDSNDEKVQRALEAVGIDTTARESKSIGEFIAENIENFEGLSDREKHRLESALRLTLNMEIYTEMVSDFREYSDNIQEAEDEDNPPKNGDTVALKRKLSTPPKDTTPLDAIRKSIKEVTDQIDTLRKAKSSPEEITSMEERLAILVGTEEQSVTTPTSEVELETDNTVTDEAIMPAIEVGAKKTDKINEAQKIKDKYQAQRDALNKSNQVTKVKPTSVKYYLSTPNSDGSFNESSAKNTFTEGATIFSLRDIGNNKYEVYANDNESSVKLALQYPDKNIDPIFNAISAYNPNAKTLQTVVPAIVELIGGKFNLISKGEITYDGAGIKKQEGVLNDSIDAKSSELNKINEAEQKELKALNEIIEPPTQSQTEVTNNTTTDNAIISESEIKAKKADIEKRKQEDLFKLDTLKKEIGDSFSGHSSTIELLTAIGKFFVNNFGWEFKGKRKYSLQISKERNRAEFDINNLEINLSEGATVGIMGGGDHYARFAPQEVVEAKYGAELAELENQPQTEVTDTVVPVIEVEAEPEQSTREENPEIEMLRRQIQTMRNQIRIVDTDDFKRFKELQQKAQEKVITPEEAQEMYILEEEVDRWIFASGAIIDGTRLSDLIEQEAILAKTPIATLEDIQPIEEQDILDTIDIPDRKPNANTHLGIHYDSTIATVFIKPDGTEHIEVFYITQEKLMERMAYIDENGNPQGELLGFEKTERGSFLIPMETVISINENTNIPLFFPLDFESQQRNYLPITEFNINMNGEMEGTYLKTDFYDNEEVENQATSEAIYNEQPDNTVTLHIYGGDPYNKELLDKYKGAKDSLQEAEEKEKEAQVQIKKEVLKEDYTERQSKELASLGRSVSIFRAKTKKTPQEKAELQDWEQRYATHKQKIETQIRNKRESALKETTKAVKRAKQDVEEQKDNLKSNLRIVALNSDNKNVSVMKGHKGSLAKNGTDRKYQIFRDSFVDQNEDMIMEMAEMGTSIALPVPPLKINKVYPGFPNTIKEMREDGTVVVKHVPFTDQNVGQVIDIGYIVGDRIETRSREQGIDTTFLGRKRDKNSKKKTPFIVFQQGNKKVAYPIRLGQRERASTDPLVKLFESDASPVEKAKGLNKMIAERGLDISEAGNSFYIGIGGIGNLNQSNFDNILAKMDQIEYFYPLDEWVKGTTPIEAILKNQALINIDLHNPIHSPKISFEMAEFLDSIPAVSETYKEKVEEATEKVKDAKQSDTVAMLKNISKEAKENVKKDC